MTHLIVVRPFGPYLVGDVVSDPASVSEVLASEHVEHVVRVDPPKED